MALSYALTADELIDVVRRLEIVSEPDWLTAGGELWNCEMGEPDCDADHEPRLTTR